MAAEFKMRQHEGILRENAKPAGPPAGRLQWGKTREIESQIEVKERFTRKYINKRPDPVKDRPFSGSEAKDINLIQAPAKNFITFGLLHFLNASRTLLMNSTV